MHRYKYTIKFLFLLVIFIFFSCASPPVPKTEKTETGGADVLFTETNPITEENPEENTVTIVAAGDNLYHDVMIREGEKGKYEAFYSQIEALVEPADIAFINQETLLAGKEFGFSGYPKFNTPQEVGRALAAAGFNTVNQATNHIMDKGEEAVFATLDFWDTIPRVKVLGVHRNEAERDRAVLIKKNNITIGFLAYTYGTNNIPAPADKPYLVSLMDTETMAREIDALRPLCDVLVVSMHWGEEYQSDCSEKQEALAGLLAEHRVDLVLGHHPHVIQPVEYIRRPDGRFMLCFYSLGNLISAQTESSTLLGALAYVKIKKTPSHNGNEADSFIFVDAGAIPLVIHYEKNFTNFMVYPLYNYTEELMDKHLKNQNKKELTLDYLTGLAAKILGNKEILANPFDTPACPP